MRHYMLVLVLGAAFAAACAGDDSDTSLDVEWTFESGDCTSNNVETIRITWGEVGATESVDFVCTVGRGVLGDTGDGGVFSISAEGLDADGIARSASHNQSLTVGSSGMGGMPIDIQMYPAPGDVTVTWTLSSGGSCPGSVILPYFITLYVAPAQAGGELVDDVGSIQESCTTGTVTFSDVAPGDYVVELDSRATTPAIRGTEEVTVLAGEDIQVDMHF
jgi:hypothetical protein